MTEHIAPHECSGCGGPVASRRPSTTGTHWCSKNECQSKKQAFYRRHRSSAEAEKRVKLQDRTDRLELVTIALHGERHPCPECNREDAVMGFAHPTASWDGVCLRLGSRGLNIGNDWAAAVWPVPERAPF